MIIKETTVMKSISFIEKHFKQSIKVKGLKQSFSKVQSPMSSDTLDTEGCD